MRGSNALGAAIKTDQLVNNRHPITPLLYPVTSGLPAGISSSSPGSILGLDGTPCSLAAALRVPSRKFPRTGVRRGTGTQQAR